MKKRSLNVDGASHLNLTLNASRTFAFNFLAIQNLSAEDFRTWFVAIGVAFSISGLAKTGILEPFLLKKCSLDKVKLYVGFLMGVTAPLTFFIFLTTLKIGIFQALIMVLGVELIVLSDLPRYLHYSKSSKKNFKSEIFSSTLLLIVALLVAINSKEIGNYLIIAFQFFIIPIGNCLILSLRNFDGDIDRNFSSDQPQENINQYIALASISMLLNQILLILLQNSLSTSHLRALKLIETLLSPFRNIGSQIWTRKLMYGTHRKRRRLSFKNLVFILCLFLLPQFTALLFSSESVKLELGLLLFCYQVGFWISMLNFDGRIELMRRKKYIPLISISFWHLLLSSLYLLLKGMSYSIFIVAFYYNIGLLFNIVFTWFYIFKYKERK